MNRKRLLLLAVVALTLSLLALFYVMLLELCYNKQAISKDTLDGSYGPYVFLAYPGNWVLTSLLSRGGLASAHSTGSIFLEDLALFTAANTICWFLVLTCGLVAAGWLQKAFVRRRDSS